MHPVLLGDAGKVQLGEVGKEVEDIIAVVFLCRDRVAVKSQVGEVGKLGKGFELTETTTKRWGGEG